MQIGRVSGIAQVLKLGHTLDSELPGKQSRKHKVVPERKCSLLDRTSVGNSLCGWFCMCVQLPTGGDSWEVPLPRSASCLTPVYSSRDNESFSPGHWLAGHSRRRAALRCGFHKRLTQTEPLSCRISAPVPYVCPPRPSGPPASKPPTTSGC